MSRDPRGSANAARPRAWLRRLAFALAVFALLCLNLELLLRWIVPARGGVAIDYGWRLRDPSFYATTDTDAYWALNALHHPQGPDVPPNEDELLGWSRWRRPDGTYRHDDFDTMGQRTPVMLYGDSFAQGMTEPEHLFQALLARSDLADEYVLLNHGLGGYGMGQAYLLMCETLDDYVGLDPIVMIGVFLDADLDRTTLALRQYPKPRFRLADGELQIDPPELGGRRAWIERHGIGITSYAWAFFAHNVRALSPALSDRLIGARERRANVRAVNRAVFAAMKDELDRRGMRGFLVLFPGRSALSGYRGFTWQEPFMDSVAEELALPFVTVRTEFTEARRAGTTLDEVFFTEGPGHGHYNARGNELAFETLRRGLASHFDR